MKTPKKSTSKKNAPKAPNKSVAKTNSANPDPLFIADEEDEFDLPINDLDIADLDDLDDDDF
jgi:hypothetical protein